MPISKAIAGEVASSKRVPEILTCTRQTPAPLNTTFPEDATEHPSEDGAAKYVFVSESPADARLVNVGPVKFHVAYPVDEYDEALI